MTRRAEDALQIACADYLRGLGLSFLHVKNQGRWSPQYGHQLNRMGRRKGALDLIVFDVPTAKLPRGVFWIECKRPVARLKNGRLSKAKATLSDEQKDFIAEMAAMGMPTLIVRSLEDLHTGMRGLGVASRFSMGSKT